MLAEEAGEPVETIVRVIWPSPVLPDLIERWMEQYQPDFVSLKVSPYWFTFESVPLKLQRKLGPIGAPMASMGLKAADTPWLAHNAVFRAGRRLALNTIGGVTHFTPEEVIGVMDACVRRVLRHEGVVLEVRGPLAADRAGSGRAREARLEARRLAVHLAMKRMCADLHIHYTGRDGPAPVDRDAGIHGGDQLHLNAEGHRRKGEEEGLAYVAAWRAAHGQHPDESAPLYLDV